MANFRKLKTMKYLKLLVITILLMNHIAYGQKLPNKQEGSVRAPLSVKIDGKPTEWQTPLQAYNHATDIYYTLANDDENLYLIVQATQPDIISRIMGGGITLGIQQSGKKDDKDAISITYPITEQTPYFNLRKKKNVVEDTSAHAADSLMMHNNALLDKYCKWIKTNGIAGLEPMIPVYNTDGIKAANLFNNKKIYTYELSVNLKLIHIPVKSGATFSYHIRINGAKSPATFTVLSATPGNEAFMEQFVAKANEVSAALAAPTDFWGEYTLAK